MKITLIMLIVCGLSLSAKGLSQNKLVSLSAKNATLVEIFEQIEAKTEYGFLFNDEQIDLSKTYTIDVKDGNVNDVLTQLLDKEGYRFTIIEDNVVISKVKEENRGNIVQQSITIKGVVSDATGEPIPGVNIFEKNSPQNGVISGIDGSYTLKVDSPDDVIVFSFIGFADQEINVAGRSSINVTLVEETTGLDEVVVVGYGTQKKANLTGAVDAVTSEVIEDRGVANLGEALQGRIANLNVSQGPGTNPSTSYNIRGTTGLRYNSDGDLVAVSEGPLILVDNVPTDANVLSQMNPMDIANVSVLKDAAASAIYGGRASFGVILVTTKQGKKEKVQVTINGNMRMSRQTLFPKWVDSYTHMVTNNEAGVAHGYSTRFKDEWIEKARLYHEDPVNNPRYEIENPVYDADGNIVAGDYRFYGTVDYMDETYKRSLFQYKTDISISGGTDKTSLYASFGYTNDEGVYKYNNDKLNNYSARVNTNTKVNDWLEVGTRMSYLKHDFEMPFQYKDFWNQNYYQRTYFPLFNPGNQLPTQHVIGYLQSGAKDMYEDDDLTLTLNAKIKLAKDLTLNGSGSYHTNIALNKEQKYWIDFADNGAYHFPIDIIWQASANSSHIYHRTRRQRSMIMDYFADYNKTIGNHNFNALVGYNQQSFNQLYYNLQRKNIITESVPSLNLTLGEPEDVSINQGEYHWAVRGAFFRFKYDYKGKYLFEANGRYDGTSRFAKDSRFGFFPSASMAWRISEESFMDLTKNWLDNLKVRLSYGSIGNQEGAGTYAYIATMDTYKPSVLLGGSKATGISTPGLVDAAITWEEVQTKNIGLDANFLRNRLGLVIDVYNRTTKGMRVSGASLPGILGTSAPDSNSADLETKGWELTLSWDDKIGDFGYGIRANVADSRAYITKYKNNPNGLLSDYYEGMELGQIWGYETAGFFQTPEEAAEAVAGGSHDQSEISGRTWYPGDIKYADLNGDGKITTGTNTVDDHGDLKVIGNSRARYNYGITANASYKNFRLEAFFQGTGKRDVYTKNSLYFPYLSRWDNIQEWQLGKSWTEDNPNAFFPRFEANAYRNYETQTKYLQSFAYIRLKAVSLSYTLPQSLIDRLPINGLSVSLNGRNLWEAHDILGTFDPEGGSNGLTEPFRRSYSIGVKINL